MGRGASTIECNNTTQRGSMNGPFPTKEARDARLAARRGVGPATDEAAIKRDDKLKLAKAFQLVYATANGKIALDHIMNGICQINQPIVAQNVNSTELLVARCTQHDMGFEIARLIFQDLDKKPEQPKVNT